MGDQLESLEASLKASDAQAGKLRQELVSLSNTGPPTFKVNGHEMNGSTSPNLPKGYYYTLADLAPAGAAAQEAEAQEQSQRPDLSENESSLESGEGMSVPEGVLSTASAGSTSTTGSNEQEKALDDAASPVGDAAAADHSPSSSSTQQRAAQPGTCSACLNTCSHWLSVGAAE